MAVKLADAANILASKEKILITAHVNPDGDALGSMVGMAHICLALGKEARIIVQSGLPEFLSWLEIPVPTVSSYAELGGWLPDLVVFLDCGAPDRVGPDGGALAAGERLPSWEKVQILNIDHHYGNPDFGDVNLVEPQAGATAELVGHVAEHMGLALSGPLGEAVYLGLSSDSGNFTYSSATPSVMAMAARIVKNGLKVEEFTEKSENNWSIGRMQLWGELMQKLGQEAGGKIVYTIITNAILKKHKCKASDLEGFVSFLRRLKDAQVSLLVREKNTVGSKISLRSMGGKSSVDVQKIAAAFGGGGHKSASGADVAMPPEEASKKVLALLVAAVEEFEKSQNLLYDVKP